MKRNHWLGLVAVLVCSSIAVRAQAPAAVDPSGHWEGAIEVPSGQILGFAIDLAKNARGELVGALSIPSQRINGLPLLKASIDGTTIAMAARTDQTLGGTVSADGQSIAGDFTMPMGTAPFSLTRKGDAKLKPQPASAAIAKALEGTWNATVDSNGTTQRLSLVLSNRADGTAVGHLINQDQGGLQLPLAIRQNGSAVTLESVSIAGSFAGTLNAAGTELTGTWMEGAKALVVTFHR